MSTSVRVPDAWTTSELGDTAAVSRRLRERGVRLDADEVGLLTELLGRVPLWPEAVLFGILWSEHCSYKSTRSLLKRLPTQAPQVILGPGEDAGVVSLPEPCEDLVLVLGQESHNHPSQVLPVEGAATGVGGIVRDVACMGAEVIGVLDALRFGDPRSSVAVRDVVRGVVQGVASYANALGVPNLGGDTVFDAAFNRNCLVNVCAVGLAPASGLLRSRVPEGPGPWVFVLVGKPTDESGFGGAAFASEALTDADDRGAVQLPDPFLKRVLLVAGQTVFARIRARGIPAGFKDLGAGGVACATSELAAAGGRGARIELDNLHRVPRPLPPEVLLCSETQERFCWVVPEFFAVELCGIYNDEFALKDIVPLAAARVIGRATEDGQFTVTWKGDTVIDCPVEAITSGRSAARPSRSRSRLAPGPVAEADQATLQDALPRLLGGFGAASREYLFRHYDSEVQGRTWLRPGEADAVVLKTHPHRSAGLAFAVGGDSRWCASDAGLGARHAVAEASRKVAITGGTPWALTDCLNFGDALDPAVMADLEESLEGLSTAARALGGLASPGAPLPFVSGNVSLYNHTGGRSIPPTPIVMCAGVLDQVAHAVPLALTRAGDRLVFVGPVRMTLAGSSFAREVLGVANTGAPPLDLDVEVRLQSLAVESARSQRAVAAHGVSAGGLLVAVTEMLLAGPAEARLGARLDVGAMGARWDVVLFDATPGVVFAVDPAAVPSLLKTVAARGLSAWVIGEVSNYGLLEAHEGSRQLSWQVETLRSVAATPLEQLWNEDLTP